MSKKQNQNTASSKDHFPRKKVVAFILVTIILLLTIFLIRYCGGLRHLGENPAETTQQPPEEPVFQVVAPPPPPPPSAPRDTVVVKQKPKKPPVKVDTVTVPTPVPVESVKIDPCHGDTVAPWVYPDPSGGLHRATVMVRFVASEPCTIEWKLKHDQGWKTYIPGDTIVLEQNGDLCFQAADSCGNKMDVRCESYEITAAVEETRCPPTMEFIEVGQDRFCIDRYEWPNRKGAKPSANVSLYQAIDSCFTLGKRLCTTQEWSLACSGIHGWNYPYGESYEPNACNCRDTAVAVSGSNPECRGYFGIFDMSGNLAEWTSTRSQANSEFYNVMGGFWNSGPQGNCKVPRYSYFPQNTHNPVGFRCCKDPQ